MLEYGCRLKNNCKYYKEKANKAWKNNYCDDQRGCNNCEFRIKNLGNEEIQKQNAAFRRSEEQNRRSLISSIIIGIIFIVLFLVGLRVS